ncbi:MAG TPA: hypothetical protein DDW52_07080 [Planctomycetaceae bacterium]|nr:hypothetical protein [Planctomycetaceae bacterium]
MKRRPEDLEDYTDEQIREIAIHAINSEGSIFDDVSPGIFDEGQSEGGIEHFHQRWEQHWWSPLMFKDNSRIKVWSTGDYEYFGVIENRSRHSDWDVYVQLQIKSSLNGKIIWRDERLGFVDIDHDDRPQSMRIKGHSEFIRKHYSRLKSYVYVFHRDMRRLRDN